LQAKATKKAFEVLWKFLRETNARPMFGRDFYFSIGSLSNGRTPCPTEFLPLG
jgi:hypothetical protein